MKINRSRDDNGVWTYHDSEEAEFVVWMSACEETPIESIDDFIEGLHQGADGKPALLPDHCRDELLDLRFQALGAYRARKTDLAVSLAERLRDKCRWFGEKFIADRAVRERMNRDGTRNGGRESLEIDTQAVLDAVGKGESYTSIAKRMSCSTGTISNIVSEHGGAIEVRKQYLRQRR